MKNHTVKPALLVIAVLLGACSSMSKPTLLEQAREQYIIAQHDPKIASHAQLELQQAGLALEQANAAEKAHKSSEDVDKLTYLAHQKISLAEEVGKQKSAEADVASAGKLRDSIRLEQRTKEADQAKLSADKSKASADASKRSADAAKARADESNLVAQAAMNDTAAAQLQTQEAQKKAEKLEQQLAALSAKKTERGLVITLGDVLFGNDRASLTAQGRDTVQQLADALKENPQRMVLIEGYADSVGSADYNQALSERRANSVRSALNEMGVGRERVAVRGYGESYPVASNKTKEDRQLNRRVEIVVSGDDGRIAQR